MTHSIQINHIDLGQ